jgi:hypothetical protein
MLPDSASAEPNAAAAVSAMGAREGRERSAPDRAKTRADEPTVTLLLPSAATLPSLHGFDANSVRAPVAALGGQ